MTTDIDHEDEADTPLLDDLAKIIRIATGDNAVDRMWLRAVLSMARYMRRNLPGGPDRFAKFRNSVDQLLARLADDADENDVVRMFVALALGKQRSKTLVRDLRILSNLAMQIPAPKPPERGRPPRPDWLDSWLGWLADEWEKGSGRPFTQNWAGKTPASLAAQFVHAIVEDVDPDSLVGLKSATRRMVKERRRPPSEK